MLYLRSIVFLILMTVLTTFLFFALIFGLLSNKIRGTSLQTWARLEMMVLKITCNLDYRVIGKNNIPSNNKFIIFANHQSVWETIALQDIFMPLIVWVSKRSLLFIPIYGWCLFLSRPISINRTASKQSLRQITQQGKKKLASGEKIVIFPEGTRMKYGVLGKFKIGGSILASQTKYPIVPVAHNAGKFWAKRGVLKKPGVVTVKIGKPIETKGKTAKQINQEVRAWMVTAVAEIA